MADTTFTDQSTIIEADWLNDVNDHVYGDVDADQIKGVTVDDTDKADGKVLAYNSTSGNLEYESASGGGVDTSGTPVANDFARFTDADTIEGRSYAEVKADLSLEVGTDVLAQQTIGIADDNLLEVDGTPNSAEYARFTANGLEGRTEAEFKTDYSLEIGTDVQAYDAELAAIAGLTSAANKLIEFTGSGTAQVIDHTGVKVTLPIIGAASDETTDLTTGTAKLTYRMPFAFTVTEVRCSVSTAPTGSTIIVDINESGTSILSTKLTIDASEKTSTTAATPAVISDSSLADDAEITIDIDQVGSGTAGAGLKVYLKGNMT